MACRLIVLIGLPGSGKSTWAGQQGLNPLSSDLIRHILSDDDNNQTIHGEVFATLRYLLKRRIELKQPVTCIDATNLTPKERRPYIATAQFYGCTAEAVYFDTPAAVCKQHNRNRVRQVPDEVIDSMAARLRPPSKDEGFTHITVVKWAGPPSPSSESGPHTVPSP